MLCSPAASSLEVQATSMFGNFCAGSRDKMNDPVWNFGTYAYAYEPIPHPSDQWP